MYVYNLLFKFPSNDGLFTNPDSRATPLGRSKTWLKLNGAEPTDKSGAALEKANWEDVQNIPTLPSSNEDPDPANAWIRVAPATDSGPLDAAATVQLAVCFGRPPRNVVPPDVACPPQASPFTDKAGNVQTTFISPPIRRDDGASGWFFPLGTVSDAKRPGHNDPRHRYEFAVGVILASSKMTLHYGEDPEMDVGPLPMDS